MNGSPEFYKLLEQAKELHSKKSHDYTTNDDPFGNYKFAGKMSKLFNDPDDSGFLGRLAEKIFRLANLDNSGKLPFNEGVADTEIDIVVITTLWMAMRKDRVSKLKATVTNDNPWITIPVIPHMYVCSDCGYRILESVASGMHTDTGNVYHHVGHCPTMGQRGV